jgi:hypothetical protein
LQRTAYPQQPVTLHYATADKDSGAKHILPLAARAVLIAVNLRQRSTAVRAEMRKRRLATVTFKQADQLLRCILGSEYDTLKDPIWHGISARTAARQ